VKNDGPFIVGASFPSPDGCNDCTCSSLGIMCTVRACAPGGSSSSSSGSPGGPPGGGGECSRDAKVCPDGTSVGRTGPNCEFPECPNHQPDPGPPTGVCPALAKVCPDGSSVSATGPNCEFPECPGPCTKEECGPAPGMPNYLCPDGKTTGGPACMRTAGACGYTVVPCPLDAPRSP
jgi:hypothetical protein